jgi:hypothetical protein
MLQRERVTCQHHLPPGRRAQAQMDSRDEHTDTEQAANFHDRSFSKYLRSLRQCRLTQESVRSRSSEAWSCQFKGDYRSAFQQEIREPSLTDSNTCQRWRGILRTHHFRGGRLGIVGRWVNYSYHSTSVMTKEGFSVLPSLTVRPGKTLRLTYFIPPGKSRFSIRRRDLITPPSAR